MENRLFDWAGGGETIVNRNYSTTMAKKLEGSSSWNKIIGFRVHKKPLKPEQIDKKTKKVL